MPDMFVSMEQNLRFAIAEAKDQIVKAWLEHQPESYEPQPEVVFNDKKMWNISFYKDCRYFNATAPMLMQAVDDMVQQIKRHFENHKQAIALLP
jgi:hypothetical protein